MQNIQYQEPVISRRNTGDLSQLLENHYPHIQIPADEISYGKYTVRFARTGKDVKNALNLQYEVFNLELQNAFIAPIFDDAEDEGFFPTNCLYLIVFEKTTEKVVGTYRICTLEMAKTTENFFSAHEFVLSELPDTFLSQAIEISRLCISREHRNKQVLFLLWKSLLNHLVKINKRYFFGCCSIFTQDFNEAVSAFEKLNSEGFIYENFSVSPTRKCHFTENEKLSASFTGEFTLPKLFVSYLKMGSRICSKPAIDREFKTVDFFMLFDIEAMSEKHYKMFFS
jgi:putative hemolysin